MSDCSHRCGGRCCSDFVISATPLRMAELYHDAQLRFASGERSENVLDTIMIAEMVIRIDEDDEVRPRYTCKHFVESTGLCGAYDQRPSMCRRYPYGRVCDHGCGYQNELEPELVTISTSSTTEDSNEPVG